MYTNDITTLTSVNMYIQATYIYLNITKSRCHKISNFYIDVFPLLVEISS